jgi:hypothetical protein
MNLQWRESTLDVSIWMTLRMTVKKRFAITLMLPLRVVTWIYFLSFLASQDKSEASEAGSQAAEEDYDVEEEYDNDYADDYFDNGEGDDLDDLGVGGGGDPSGGGALVSFIHS